MLPSPHWPFSSPTSPASCPHSTRQAFLKQKKRPAPSFLFTSAHVAADIQGPAWLVRNQQRTKRPPLARSLTTFRGQQHLNISSQAEACAARRQDDLLRRQRQAAKAWHDHFVRGQKRQDESTSMDLLITHDARHACLQRKELLSPSMCGFY